MVLTVRKNSHTIFVSLSPYTKKTKLLQIHVTAAERLCLYFPEETKKLLKEVKGLQTNNNNNKQGTV